MEWRKNNGENVAIANDQSGEHPYGCLNVLQHGNRRAVLHRQA